MKMIEYRPLASNMRAISVELCTIPLGHDRNERPGAHQVLRIVASRLGEFGIVHELPSLSPVTRDLQVNVLRQRRHG